MNENRISISNLKKTYANGVTALKGVNLDILPGMFGLLGPNGAGKTTLMKILATVLEADDGKVEMNGTELTRDVTATRRLLGYLPQDFGFYPSFTAGEMLAYMASLKGVTNRRERETLVDVLLDRVNLADERDRKLGGFSGGMRQRLGIAQALIGQPRLLIVDEPTAGLDPEERLRFHNLLAEIAGDESTVLLSTHIVSDVANLCSQMAIIRRGEIISTTAPADAIEQISGRVWEATLPLQVAQEIKPRLSLISSQMVGGKVRLRVYSETGKPDETFYPVSPTLEDYYFSLVRRS